VPGAPVVKVKRLHPNIAIAARAVKLGTADSRSKPANARLGIF